MDSKSELDVLKTLISRIDRDRQKSSGKTREVQLQAWRGLAGANLDRMMRSPEQAVAYLSDANRNHRIAAIAVLSSHFGLTRELQTRWEQMAQKDENAGVRLHAKLCLVECYADVDRPKRRTLLAQLVKDNSLSDGIRLACYGHLYAMDNRPLENSPVLLDHEGRFHFPDDVDWGFVNSFLESGGTRNDDLK